MRKSSPRLSTLKQPIPALSAKLISSTDFPTPEKITDLGSPPTASTRLSSPAETMSKPAPNDLNKASMAKLELALTE